MRCRRYRGHEKAWGHVYEVRSPEGELVNVVRFSYVDSVDDFMAAYPRYIKAADLDLSGIAAEDQRRSVRRAVALRLMDWYGLQSCDSPNALAPNFHLTTPPARLPRGDVYSYSKVELRRVLEAIFGKGSPEVPRVAGQALQMSPEAFKKGMDISDYNDSFR
jgi:hypothetical protein